VALEEFEVTITRVNALLETDLPRGFLWCVAGYLCCACTAGLSLAPGLYMRDRVRGRTHKWRGVLCGTTGP
jgi:hypothetical protein